jgi:hypothetical protein
MSDNSSQLVFLPLTALSVSAVGPGATMTFIGPRRGLRATSGSASAESMVRKRRYRNEHSGIGIAQDTARLCMKPAIDAGRMQFW